MTGRKETAFAYAKGKLFVKLAGLFLCCIAALVVMAAIREDMGLVLFPAVVSLIPAGLAVYYAVLFRQEKISGTICSVVEKKKDMVGGLLSGLSLNRCRYYLEFENEKGEKNVFHISRGGLFSSLTVGQSCLVLHKNCRELSSDNFIECVAVDTEDAY